MLPALHIAASSLEAQSRKLEGVALIVALTGAQQAQAAAPPAIEASPVRVRNLPVGNPVESMVSLKEAELAYRMNAAVIKTADDVLQSLLDAVDPDRR